MTDIEITRLCAEAMGIATVPPPKGYENLIIIAGLNSPYAPLHDDAQAMALVKKFGIEIRIWGEGLYNVSASKSTKRHGILVDSCWTEDENLNRAICLCVAKMQASKP